MGDTGFEPQAKTLSDQYPGALDGTPAKNSALSSLSKLAAKLGATDLQEVLERAAALAGARA